MKKMFFLFLFSCLFLFSEHSFADQGQDLAPFQSLKGALDIVGGTAHIPVMKHAAKNIMEANPSIHITVAGGGSGVGVQKLGEGLAQIGNTGRALKAEEIEKYGLVSFPFALDGVAVVVHPENPVATLSTVELQEIFSGKIDNWSALGGRNAPITVYVREDGSGTRETFEEQGLRKAKSSSKASVLNSNGAIKTAVAKDPNAISYVGIGHVDKSVKALALDNSYPSQENAATGTYPVTRLLYMNTKGEAEGLSKAFIEYIYSPSGAAIIQEAGYIPVPAKK